MRNMSRLEVITGPMFSGKTEELIRRLHRAQIAGRDIKLFKPQIDDRYGYDVTTHNGMSFPCQTATDAMEVMLKLFHDIYPSGNMVVGIDEAQFFDSNLPEVVHEILKKVGKVIVSGLDKDFATQDFGSIPRLMVLADKLDKLTAVCNKCGADDASFTQRLVNGKPAAWDGPTILVGGTESYEARCRDHFEQG
jgi:thymidine kinase